LRDAQKFIQILFGMLNLNLISREDKDAFRFLAYRRAVLCAGAVMSAILVIFIVLLLPSFLFLNFQRKEILRELALEEESLRTFGVEAIERRIARINERIALIRAGDFTESRTSRILEQFALLAGNVRINRVFLDFQSGRIEIDGIAPTRNALLAFKRSLGEEDFVREISAPLSDLVKVADVAFTFRGSLK
jgi:hypothetical protein